MINNRQIPEIVFRCHGSCMSECQLIKISNHEMLPVSSCRLKRGKLTWRVEAIWANISSDGSDGDPSAYLQSAKARRGFYIALSTLTLTIILPC